MFKVPSRLPTLLFLALLLGVRLAGAVEVQHSPADPREYAYEVLDNGLRVVLVSDPETPVAAVALDVHVGSGDDPDARPGLAHFLEHMLFLGTDRYPQAGEYQAYIAAHGGQHNAYTSFEHTNYHFEVEASALVGALDRFARFFVAPRMDPAYVERERRAVHAEYSARLRSDGRRGYEAFKRAVNQDHPFSRFFAGNEETLADRPGAVVRDDLLAFYEQHYRAGNMTLAVVGRQPLVALRALVLERFAGIPAGTSERPRVEQPLFAADALPARLDVVPLRETRSLRLVFPVPPQQALYRSKPVHYVAHLLGHEGAGSLLSALRQRGLADALSAGGGLEHRHEATLELSIALTERGLAQLDTVLGLVFDQLEAMREEGAQRWRFDELARMAAIDFRFLERGDAGAYARALSHNLHRYPAVDVVRAGLAFDTFDANAIDALLDRLRASNVLLVVTAPGLQSSDTTRYFDAPYALAPVPDRIAASWGGVARDGELVLPPPNPYLPERLEMHEPQAESAADSADGAPLPTILVQQPGFALWHALDTSFDRPLASFFLSLRSPAATASARGATLTRLLVSMIQEQLTESTYAASLAGLQLSVYAHGRGLSIRVHGYSDKHAQLVLDALAAVLEPELLADRFERVRERLRRGLANKALGSPYSQAMSELRHLLLEPHWSDEQMLAALRDIDLEDLRSFADVFLSELDAVALSHGNVGRDEAAALADTVGAALRAVRAEAVAVARADVVKLAEGETLRQEVGVDHDDVAVLRYYQGSSRDHDERVATALLGQLLAPAFYTELRTEQQLGYVVFASAMPLMDVPGLAFVVQSPGATAEVIARRIDAFVRDSARFIAELDASAFAGQRDALLARLLERDDSLQARSDRYWQEMDRPGERLDDRERLAAALRDLQPEAVKTAHERLFGPDARALTVVARRGAEGAAGEQDTAAPPLDAADFRRQRGRFSGGF